VVSMLASGTQVRGFTPGRSLPIFRAKKKIHSMPSFGGKVKPSVPSRRFAACKRTLQFPWKSNCRLNLIGHFSPIVPPFASLTSYGVECLWRYIYIYDISRLRVKDPLLDELAPLLTPFKL
jgi:hypothetical protein